MKALVLALLAAAPATVAVPAGPPPMDLSAPMSEGEAATVLQDLEARCTALGGTWINFQPKDPELGDLIVGCVWSVKRGT